MWPESVIRLLETLNKFSCLYLIFIKSKSVTDKTYGIYQINVACHVLFYSMARCYICVKQGNVNLCRYKIQNINDSSVLVYSQIFT